MPAVKRGELTEDEIAEIEAVNNHQAASLDAAMNNMRAGVPGAAIAPAATRAVEASESATIDIPVLRKDTPTYGPLPADKQPRVPASLPPIPAEALAPKKPANDGGASVRSSRWEIDDDVPIPEKPALNGRSYPWDKLNVGQSFFIPEDGRKHRGKLTSMYAAHKRFKGARRFRAEWTDKDPKRGISGFRVWRVS